MGTSFFHENNFEGLLEKIRDRGKVGSYQQQVNAQMRRLFGKWVNPLWQSLPQ